MKIVSNVILAVLVFLALSSAVTKIMLLPREVEFFGQYGFTTPILVVYGIAQLVGGVLLVPQKTRAIGAVIVAITFLISAVVLFKSGNIPLVAITLVFVLLLGFIIKQSFKQTDQLPEIQ